MSESCLVRIVDDDAEVRDSIRTFLSLKEIECAEYDCAESFLSGDDFKRSGCIVLDVRMPGMSGIEVQNELIRRHCDLPIIFLSAHGDIEMSVSAIHKGAKTFLVKPVDPERLLTLVEESFQANIQTRREKAYEESLWAQWNELTPSEKQVAILVGKGFPNSTIAETLELKERTVRAYRASIYAKLDVLNAVEVAEVLNGIADRL